ncbi:signal peptidase I [Knoellia sp. CPCC 206435]|uniref:signal peptidase I n=1 Tax=Knoellia terrae TaxID=3404797 RepID=UPI003B43BCBB
MHRFVQVARRSLRVLGSLALLVVTLGGAAYIVPGLLGYERYVITGGSMSGAIERGSVAFEKRIPVQDLAVGDVITYLPPPDSGVSDLVTHRITKVEPGQAGSTVFSTQGDANPDPDPWTFALTEGTQPVVAHTVPLVGYVFVALADPQVRMAVIGGPAAVIALLALRDLVGAVRPDRTRPHVPTRSGAGLPV